MESVPDPVRAMREFAPPGGAAHDWSDWLKLHDVLASGAWPDDVALAARWYQPHLERLHDDSDVRQADLAQLGRIAAAYPNRERFLAEITLDPPEATSDEAGAPHRDEDYLILSTMHSAKGQEWTAVYVLNAVDGCMPSDMATGQAAEIEEERRLLYVAMTRAKRHLALIAPQRFYVTQQAKHGDRHLYGSLTRFIPPPVQALFDGLRLVAAEDPTPDGRAGLPTIDLQARVRQAF
jgi:DNA helicase-2/ATP-dependent DNA helicase PcrA